MCHFSHIVDSFSDKRKKNKRLLIITIAFSFVLVRSCEMDKVTKDIWKVSKAWYDG